MIAALAMGILIRTMVPKKIPTNMTISEDVRAELIRMADEERVTLSAFVDRILTEWLKSKDKLKKPKN
jgi:hypothetical protein